MHLQNTYKNIYEFSGIVEDISKKYGYYFEFDEEMHKKQIIELNKKGHNIYSALSIKSLISEYSKTLFLNEKDAQEYLLNKFENASTWLNKSDKHKYEIDVRDISSVYKNR